MSTTVAAALQRLFFGFARPSRRADETAVRRRAVRGARQADFSDTRPLVLFRSEAFAEDLCLTHRVG